MGIQEIGFFAGKSSGGQDGLPHAKDGALAQVDPGGRSNEWPEGTRTIGQHQRTFHAAELDFGLLAGRPTPSVEWAADPGLGGNLA